MSANAVAVRSGGIAVRPGLYLASGHYHGGTRMEILLQAGRVLPKCSACGREIDWNYVGEFNPDTTVVL